ncbi:asparagine synthetase B, partial [uncultured Desulfovibrio sp.]|uniref:asparagine synthetase B family protein n=1 Tax=uncultured Desulfovibrio sp. TaxID=167968 RepID=UPI002634B246
IFGIKPLLYRTDGLFAFSSELPPLAALACLPQPGVDASALAQFFRYQYIAAPRTIYKDIRKLPPAHCMLVDFSGGIKKIWQYHAFHFAPAAIGHDEALAATERVIQSTVAASTVADVPIGVYLSGGIDSTLMALCLTRVVGRSIPAFTIAFREEGFSELPFAQRAAQHLGLNLHEEYVESMARDKLPDILAPYGEPFGDSSVLPTWHLAQLTRRHVKVVFSGDGGDELFGGYSSYAHWLTELRRRNLSGAMRAAMTFRPKEALRCLRSVWRRSKRDVDTWHRFMECNTPKAVARLLTPDFRSHAGDMADVFSSVKGHERDFASDLDMAQYLDIRTYLPEDILYKVDVTSMQHSLEARPAFLSPDVLAHACRLPEECRRQEAGGGKVMLKELLLEAGFPPSFVHRRKQGFAIPVNAWFTRKGAARALLMDMLATHGREMAAYIDLRNVQELLARHDASPRNGEQCWLVLAFALWLESRKKPAAAPA